MLIRVCKKFLRSRRAATAMLVAIALVPMMIVGATAIDMARVTASRTILQAAVDAAAIAGGGAYGNSGSNTAAITAAQAAYAGATASMGGMASNVTAGNASSLVGAYCNTTSGSTPCGSATTDTTGNCPTSGGAPAYQYCVVVQASLDVNSILAAYIIPKASLTVKGVDTVGRISYQVSPGSFSSTSVGNAGDINDILAYVVPTDSSGNADFSSVPAAFSTCTGLITEQPNVETVPSGTQCNFLLIGTSDTQTQGNSNGTLNFSSGDFISFAFANLVGGHNDYGWVPYYTGLTLTTTNWNGTTTTPLPNGACTKSSSPYYTKTSCNSNSTYLYGECPDHNLYGGISQGGNPPSGLQNFGGVPISDSLTIYSAAYEMLGYPTTHNANHVLTGFTTTMSETLPINNNNNYNNTQTYNVTVTCPDWPTNAAAASRDKKADLSSNNPNNPTNTQYSSTEVPVDTNISAFSTYYPDISYPDSTNSVYPPFLQSSCSPAVAYPVKSGTTTEDWWGWSRNNATNGSNYCRNQPTITNTSTYDPSYNNCALIIQALGNGVPTVNGAPQLPSYYVAVKTTDSSSAIPVLLDPVYDNATFTDLYPGVLDNLIGQSFASNIGQATNSAGINNTNGYAVTITDTDPSGAYPGSNVNGATIATGSYQITNGKYAGDYAYIETPASNGGNTLNSLPPETSYRCYNPQQNGFSSTAFVNTNNDNGTAIDHIANPQLGAVDCSGLTGYSFGLYWNDLGSTEKDDLGYMNAVTVFTCPTPSYSAGSSAPSTLSG